MVSRPPSVPATSGGRRARIAKGAHEAHELGHHDQRPGRGLGEPQAVQHLAGREPAVGLDGGLGDVGEHRIGAAEGHHRHLREEQRDLGEDVARPEGHGQQRRRHEPQREEDGGDLERPGQRRAGMRRQRLAEQRCRHRPPGARRSCRGRRRAWNAARPARPPSQPISAAARMISGNGTSNTKIATNAAAASATIVPVGERAPADAQHRLEHDREHRGLEAEEQRGDQRQVAERGIEPAQRHDREHAGQHEQRAGDEAALGLVQQPADVDRELLRLGPRQQHAEVERVQEAPLAEPALLLDQDAVHHRDLAGRAAEAQRGDPQPDPHRLGERDAVGGDIGRQHPPARGVRHRPCPRKKP